MKHRTQFIAILVTSLVLLPTAGADKGNWKKGRIYYKMVCSECHQDMTGVKFSPADKTKAEWTDYFTQDLHAAGNTSVNNTVEYYVSKEYRGLIKDNNRAAAKLYAIPDGQLLEDVKAFTVHTAKDSDQPSRCE